MKISNSIFVLLCILHLYGCQNSPKESIDNDSKESVNVSDEKFISFDQWLDNPKPLVSAHRGGPYPGYPENAIETFENIANQTSTLIECDVSMTKDSVLILMHDKTLDRTTTGSGNVVDVTYDEIKSLFLIDNEGDTTSLRVPTLEEVLSWGNGKVLFTLDVKRGVPFEKVISIVEKLDAVSYSAIITYRIEDAVKVYSLNPELMISVSAGSEGALNQIVESGIPSDILLGFVGTREPDAAHYGKLKELGIKSILGN